MSFLSEELQRQMKSAKPEPLNGLGLARRSGLSRSQVYKWTSGHQRTINEDQLTVLALALSGEEAENASLVRAHLLDEKFGPGSDLVQVEITGVSKAHDRRAEKSKGEQALHFLVKERITNPDLNRLLIDLALALGAKLGRSS